MYKNLMGNPFSSIKERETSYPAKSEHHKEPKPDMSDNTVISLDQPSDEAIAKLYAMTRGPGIDEIFQLNLPATYTDEEGGSREDFDFSDSELPTREDIKPKKKKKKSKSSKSSKEKNIQKEEEIQPVLEGVSSVAHYITPHEQTQ